MSFIYKSKLLYNHITISISLWIINEKQDYPTSEIHCRVAITKYYVFLSENYYSVQFYEIKLIEFRVYVNAL